MSSVQSLQNVSTYNCYFFGKHCIIYDHIIEFLIKIPSSGGGVGGGVADLMFSISQACARQILYKP